MKKILKKILIMIALLSFVVLASCGADTNDRSVPMPSNGAGVVGSIDVVTSFDTPNAASGSE